MNKQIKSLLLYQLSYRGKIYRGDSSHRDAAFCQMKTERQDFSAATDPPPAENSQFETAGMSIKVSAMKGKILLPAIFVVTFALSRIPGLLPPNFSAAYAFAFCAGACLRGSLAWWLPLGTMLATDVALNLGYYHVAPIGFYLVLNYACYALLIGLGRWFGRNASFFKLLLGGTFGAVIFYLMTNTLSWLQDAAYAKTLAGWFQALTTGRPDFHPTTWEMFRNTLASGGLFTALFAVSEKLTAESPVEKKAGVSETDDQPAAEAEEAKA